MNSILQQKNIVESDVHACQKRDDNRIKPLRYRITHFDLDNEDWGSGTTARLYKCYSVTLPLQDREQLYLQILEDVVKGKVGTTSLLAFAIFEPHMKIACKAVRDYLAYRTCNIEDEFAGVHEVVGILANIETANKGAVLAGLVSVGDRRINAVARAARHLLSADDVKSFSRVQNGQMRTSSVEFCLDWLTELNQHYCKDAVCNIASALMLMVVHDEQGVVEDLSEINYIGFKTTKVLQTQTFESYYSEILPILNYLKNCDRFESAISMVIELWDGHKAKARLLRERGY